MGQVKQLLPLGNKLVIRHCLDTIIAAGVRDIVVVVEPKSEGKIAEALQGLPIRMVTSSNPDAEMAQSVRTGLRAVSKSFTGVLICLSDHPLASAQTLKLLITTHRENPHKIIVPFYDGKGGHPSLFPREIVEEIFSGCTLREILRRDPDRVKYVAVADEGVILDMDTVEDYQRMHEKYKNQRTDK